jgi:hypothetical protein
MCAKSKPMPQKSPSKIIAGIRSLGRKKPNFKIVITKVCKFWNGISNDG